MQISRVCANNNFKGRINVLIGYGYTGERTKDAIYTENIDRFYQSNLDSEETVIELKNGRIYRANMPIDRFSMVYGIAHTEGDYPVPVKVTPNN